MNKTIYKDLAAAVAAVHSQWPKGVTHCRLALMESGEIVPFACESFTANAIRRCDVGFTVAPLVGFRTA